MKTRLLESLSRNDAVDWRSARVSRAVFGVSPNTLGARMARTFGCAFCTRGQSARRRLEQPRRLRSPFRTAFFRLSPALVLAFALCVWAQSKDDGFVSIFDGQTLKGWHVSGKTGHSRASKNQSGGRWVVEHGAIIGSQDIPGNGGIVITDEPYGDFEVALEMNNDFGPDSGLFLRSTEDGIAWQAMVDYHANGNVMGIYGEGLGGKPSVRNYSFLDSPEKITAVTNSPVALPVLPESWPHFWRHGQWNELRARIVGNPPHLTTWINGVKIMEWQEKELRHPDKGGIALQVHGGGNMTNQFVRYRNIRVKPIDARQAK